MDLEDRLPGGRVPVNDEIVRAARELLEGPSGYRSLLRKIVNGQVKTIDADWWRSENGVTPWQLDKKQEKGFNAKLEKVKVMADPARNPNAHQRQVAEAMLAKMEAAGPPRVSDVSAPGLKEYDRRHKAEMAAQRAYMDAAFKHAKARWDAEQAAAVNTANPVNTTKPRPATRPKPKPSVNTTKRAKPEPVNTIKPKQADRHLEPNRDRHSAGYMREYMRRRRAEQKR
jgi:hypothetical protein